MTYEEDLDLADRLRRIAADPEPAVPGSMYRYADQVVEGMTMNNETAGQRAPIEFTPARGAAARRPVRVLAGLAAALVVVMALGTLLIAVNTNRGAATPPVSSDQWTGLEWHDITAASDGLFAAPAWESGGVAPSNNVVAWSGGLVASSVDGIWTSTDGRSWTHEPGSPTLTSLTAIGGGLIGVGQVSQPCASPASLGDTCMWPGGIWFSNDGVTWRSVSVPFGDQYAEDLTSTSRAAVVLTSPFSPGGSGPAGPYALYATTDGTSWSLAALPEDISKATFVQAYSLREGILVSAEIPGPTVTAPTSVAGQNGVPAVTVSNSYWFSGDGLAWSRAQLDPTLQEGVGMGVYGGVSGDAAIPVPNSLHSSDGSHWVKDTDQAMAGIAGQMVAMSDGRHILLSGGWDPVFNVSVGDGHWRRLDQGGDIGSLPGGGQIFLLPNGMLYAGGGRLYFGQAVSGSPLTGTLHPAATITPPPTPTPTQGTPRPSVTRPPATAWTAVSGVRKLDYGPAGAESLTRWKGGYVAVRNAPASGGLLTVWTSSDGRAWTQLPDGTFGKATTAVVAQDAEQVVIATWGGENNVWVSSDGSSWAKSPNGNPPIGDRPMAGNSWGMVAIMDDPQYQLVFDLDWHTVTIPGIDVNSIQDVAVSGDTYVAVGHVGGTAAGSTRPAAWWTTDGTTWTEGTTQDAFGAGFTSVVAGRDGFVAAGSESSGSSAYWSSADGRTWKRGAGPWGLGETFTGDGVHIVASGIGSSGEPEFWTSLDGQNWTKLSLAGDAAPALSSAASVSAYPIQDGVLFVTLDGAWYGQAVVGK